MLILAHALVILVALLHLYFLVLEMFLWTRPLGLKTFRNSPEKAETTRVLAANQGLYNGFLAAGLFWVGRTLEQFVFLPVNHAMVHVLTALFVLGAVLFALPLLR